MKKQLFSYTSGTIQHELRVQLKPVLI